MMTGGPPTHRAAHGAGLQALQGRKLGGGVMALAGVGEGPKPPFLAISARLARPCC